MQKYLNNPDFPEEVGMYLEANGFKRADGKYISFFKDDLAIVTKGNVTEFLRIDTDGYDEFVSVAKYAGIQNILGIFEWMLLFHVTGFISLKDFIKEVRKEMVFDKPAEMLSLFGHNAMAANY